MLKSSGDGSQTVYALLTERLAAGFPRYFYSKEIRQFVTVRTEFYFSNFLIVFFFFFKLFMLLFC